MSLSVIDKYVEKKKKDILEYAKILESLITLEDNKMWSNKSEFSVNCKEIIAIYDFSLINRYDIFYPDDVMQVFIPMESEAEYAIYYYDGSSLEKLNSTYTDGELIFSTSHFSEYVITKIEDKNVVDHQNRYIFLIGFIVLAIIIIAMIIIVIKKRHKKTIQ